jgi:hypothetical protein
MLTGRCRSRSSNPAAVCDLRQPTRNCAAAKTGRAGEAEPGNPSHRSRLGLAPLQLLHCSDSRSEHRQHAILQEQQSAVGTGGLLTYLRFESAQIVEGEGRIIRHGVMLHEEHIRNNGERMI